MRFILGVGIMLALPSSAAAQTRAGVRAGGALMSTLVRDSIVEPLTVRPAPAPSLGFWIEARLDAHYSAALSLTTTWSGLRRHEPGVTDEIVPLTTWIPAVSLSRTVYRGFAVYGRAGAIIYRADRTAANLFREGAPPAPLLGLGVSWSRPLASSFDLRLNLEYDAHRFSTPALRTAGFRGERMVHRVGLSVGVSRGL